MQQNSMHTSSLWRNVDIDNDNASGGGGGVNMYDDCGGDAGECYMMP